MNTVHVLKPDLTLQGIVDDYESLIWRPAYNDIGDFELYLPASNKNMQLLTRDRFLVRDSDISVNGDVTTYKKVMIIKNIKLTTDIENGDYLTITGREIKYILHQRIIWTQTNLSGTAEAGIRRLIDECIVNPTVEFRAIDNFILAPELGLSDALDKQVTGDYLDNTVMDICKRFDYGWDIYIQGGNFVFTLYEGVNRSYTQTANPYVLFSDTFDNLDNTEYQLTSDTYANTYLIGGEGEGTERIYMGLEIAVDGLERYETFVDAKDISQNKGTENEISLSDYKKLLAERLREAFKEHRITETFLGDVVDGVTYKYGVDYNLGDTVTVINSYGKRGNARIMSVIESDDVNGTSIVPQFVY